MPRHAKEVAFGRFFVVGFWPADALNSRHIALPICGSFAQSWGSRPWINRREKVFVLQYAFHPGLGIASIVLRRIVLHGSVEAADKTVD